MEQPTFDQATRKKRQIGKRNFKEKYGYFPTKREKSLPIDDLKV